MMRFNVVSHKPNAQKGAEFELISENNGRENRDARQREIASACAKKGPGAYEAFCGEEYHKLLVRSNGEVFDLGRQRVINLSVPA